MNYYSSNWFLTILAAMFFHFVAGLGFYSLFSYLVPPPEIEMVDDTEWTDIYETEDEEPVNEEDAFPSEEESAAQPTQVAQSPFRAEDLVIPDLPMPEPVIVDPIELPPPPEPIRIERFTPRSREVELPSRDAELSARETEPAPVKEEISPQLSKQLLTKPPVVVNEVYPEKGSGLGYKGYVSIAVHIGKDGKVQSTEVLQTSGRYFVDEIAIKAAKQWTFRPALDQFGRAMECDKIITFDFRKFA